MSSAPAVWLTSFIELCRHIHVPGYQDNELVPYRRPAASELHRARQVAVRRSAAGLAPLGGGRGSARRPLSWRPARGRPRSKMPVRAGMKCSSDVRDSLRVEHQCCCGFERSQSEISPC